MNSRVVAYSKATILVVLVLVFCGVFVKAQAGTITFGDVTAANPTNIEDFTSGGSIPLGTTISNEFSGNGLTFTTQSGVGAVYLNEVYCPLAMSGEYLLAGAGPGCFQNQTQDDFSIAFFTDVAEASFYSQSVLGVGYLFEALDDGVLVASSTFVGLSAVGTFLVTGSVFDELRFTAFGADPATNASFFTMDDLAWQAATGQPVPEPATILLLGVGLIGLAGFKRRFIK